jgi:hypothetical protein
VRLALVLRQGQERRVPTVGAHARSIADRKPGVVADVRPWNALDLVLVEERRPDPGQVDLRTGRTGAERPQADQEHDDSQCISLHETLEVWLELMRQILVWGAREVHRLPATRY